MVADRSDEIRATVLRSRLIGWAARLGDVAKLLDGSTPEPILALAVVQELQREMAPYIAIGTKPPSPGTTIER